jgi:hypothetical protein
MNKFRGVILRQPLVFVHHFTLLVEDHRRRQGTAVYSRWHVACIYQQKLTLNHCTFFDFFAAF